MVFLQCDGFWFKGEISNLVKGHEAIDHPGNEFWNNSHLRRRDEKKKRGKRLNQAKKEEKN